MEVGDGAMGLNEKFTAIANSIRAKTGKTEKLTLDQMVTEINSISTSEYTGETYDGSYSIRPSIEAQVMETKDKLMTDNVTIQAIPYHTVDNAEMGQTVIIGGVDVYGG